MDNEFNISLIKNYLIDYKKDYILSVSKKTLPEIFLLLKNDVISNIPGLTESILESKSEPIRSFIHAIIKLDNLEKDYTDVYKDLLTCKDGKSIKTFFKDIVSSKTISNNFTCSDAVSNGINYILNQRPNITSTTGIIKSSLTNVKSCIDLDNLIKSDMSFRKELENLTDDDIRDTISSKFENSHSISTSLIDEWILKYKNTSPLIVDTYSSIITLTTLSTEKLKELTDLHEEIKKLTAKISTLESTNAKLLKSLESTNNQNQTLKSSLEKKDPLSSVRDTFSIELKKLNRLSNTSSTECQITIKEDILNRASKFIDANNLIEIEDIISNDRDLKSQIIQLITLAFLHEKTLY